MAAFLVVYDPSKGKEQEMVAALHRWGATCIFRGAWVIEFNSTADLARRAPLAARGTPFVLATGDDERGLPELYRDRPMLAKPFRIDRLERMLQSVTDSK